MSPENLFDDLPAGLPADLPDERVDVLLEGDGVRVERIVSRGHASPPDFWYDQAEDEWVLLLAGAARLRIEGTDEPVSLRPGDHLTLPAHCRHRVEWTDPDRETVWLAVLHRPSSA